MSGRGAWRIAFWVYAAALFTLTHWPNAKLPPMAIKRPDLLLHIALFGTWSFLLVRTGYLRGDGRSAASPWRRVLLPLLVAVAYAAIDEGLQAVPVLRRTAVLDDCAANVLGAALGWMAGILMEKAWPRPAANADPRP